ncbi:S-layer homology domain-containing protein [Paenibacillus sp. p3-SID1389]|uniref:S-layer homology domain-containing protein n=1 Tax=Paenibacillus sp. p3-SID1389 TaxID=2916364 RepID=UPI0021A59417|nr:S-layer homology domain-containing protein [Paenibacillus sp. p3-SID1389]MCT2195531.1 S-layer homology domain-containing protein [Paenibacillus sp. p3-SID1389]
MASYKRTFQRSTRKAVSAMLVTAMCLGGTTAAFAEETPAVTTSQSVASVSLFSDVPNGFWAEKHIYKLAAEGILLGDAGKFRPGDNVTQQEAITMAIRFMNLDSQLGNGAGAPADLKVGNYFKPYLELALSKNLIDKNEELASTKEGEAWGEKKASREWVAKLLVRALGKDAEAKASATLPTGFADQTSISANARGYVNVAVQLKLTNGVEGNRFDPLGKVTRAQIATFFSRGSEYVNPGYANVYEGIVTELTGSKLTLYTNGQLKSFTLDNRSVYFTKDSETRTTQSALKLYTKVLAVDKVGSAAYVEVTDPNQQLERSEGTLLRVLGNNQLLLLVNNNPLTLTYDSNTTFVDQYGNSIKVSDLTPESTVVVQRETFTSDKKPVIIQLQSVGNVSGSGTVSKIDLTGKNITIKLANGNEETFKFNDKTILLYQNQVLNQMGEVNEGASVTFEVKDGVLDSLVVTQATERTVTGTLLDLVGDTLLSYTNAGGRDEIKRLAKNVTVEINGIADASLDDLITDEKGGDKVELTLNPDDEVTKIVVTGRQSEKLESATVINYDTKTKALTVLDASEKPYVFVIDEKTKYSYNTTNPTLSGLESQLSKGRKIDLTVVGSRVVNVDVTYKYEGTYVSANTSSKKITILQNNGKTVEIPYQGTTPTISIYGKANASLADLKAGDAVTAMLTANQDALQTLAVKSSIQFEVVSVNTANSRIRATANGVTSEFYVDQAVLLGENGGAIKVSDLKAGQTINVTFNGQTAISLQVVKLTLGKVQSVDGSTLLVKSFAGNVETYSLASGVKVQRGTEVSTSVTSLTTSDHVEVRKDTNGAVVVKVLTPQERKFSRYDGVSKEIIVLRSSTSDNNYRFAVTADTYIHQGDTTISVQSLQINDKIVLYFNGDKLVEVEKQ